MTLITVELLSILKTKIGILGLGAIGSVIAYQLHQQALHDLVFFSRTHKRELKLQTENTTLNIPINIITSPPSNYKLDWLIICLKEHHYQDARSWFSKLITSETSVVVIRNGLQLKAPLLEFTGKNNILECIIDCPTQLNSGGFYACLGHPKLIVPRGELSHSFKLLFTPDIQIDQVTDFKTQNWKKLCESAALGGILCFHNDTCRILIDATIQLHYKNLLKECIAVGRADGANIEDSFIESIIQKTMRYPQDKGNSMLTDMRQGKPLEFGAKNGIIIQMGKRYHIPTPLNDEIVAQLS